MPPICLRHKTATLLAVAAVAVVLRMWLGFSLRQNYYAWYEEIPKQPKGEIDYLRTGLMELSDSQQYLLLARSLPAYHWDGRPNTFRPPGYPLLIRLCCDRIPVIVVFQALLGGLSVLGVGWLGWRWFGWLVGVIAAGLLAIDVPSLFYSGLVMSETLFAALVVLAVVLHERGWLSLTGLALGTAALVRPVGLILILPFAFAAIRRHGWTRAIRLIAAFVLLPALWCGRNWLHYHRFSFGSNGAFNLLYSNAAAVVADQQGIERDSARSLLASQVALPESETNPLRAAELLERQALRVISGDPLRYIGLILRGVAWTMTGTKSDELVGFLTEGVRTGYEASLGRRLRSAGGVERTAVIGLSLIELVLTLGSLLLALLALFYRGTRARVLLPLGIVLCLVLAVGPFTDGRFRVPVMPLVYLSAAAGLRRWTGQYCLQPRGE